jgi:hypothetical protein
MLPSADPDFCSIEPQEKNPRRHKNFALKDHRIPILGRPQKVALQENSEDQSQHRLQQKVPIAK